MRLDQPGELTLDFVYYGPPLSGKSTSIKYIHDRTVPERRSEIQTTRQRFDLRRCDILPATIPPIAGRSVRLSLRCIHGVCFPMKDRLVVLPGADGVVFVADSGRGRLESNLYHAEELFAFLRECAEPPPVVWTYNKRDLPAKELSTVPELDAALPAHDGPRLPTSALHGVGVFDVLRTLTSLVEARLRANFAVPRSVTTSQQAKGVRRTALPSRLAARSSWCATIAGARAAVEDRRGGNASLESRVLHAMSWTRRLMIFATIAAASCVRRPASSEVTTAASFSLAELRAEVDRYVCAVWEPEVRLWSLAMLGEECGAVRDPALGDVVRGAVERSKKIVPLATAAYEAFDAGASGLDQASADALARRSVWSDPLLSHAILLQLRRAIEAMHARCDDCPRLTVAPVEVEWEGFVPYLRAYLWPVQATPDGPVDIFVCSGTNGAAELPANEPLRQAGFLVAVQFADDAEMTAQIEQLHARHNGDASRSAHGMAREIDALIQSPTARARTCRALREVEWFTGVMVRACEPTSPTRAR